MGRSNLFLSRANAAIEAVLRRTESADGIHATRREHGLEVRLANGQLCRLEPADDRDQLLLTMGSEVWSFEHDPVVQRWRDTTGRGGLRQAIDELMLRAESERGA